MSTSSQYLHQKLKQSKNKIFQIMGLFRQDNYFIVYPRSKTTLIQFGIGEESFIPPKWEIPTKVYRDVDGKFTSKQTDDVVFPIVNGSITNLDGFLYLMKLLYQSVLNHLMNENESNWKVLACNIPMLILTHYSWSQHQIELIIQFVFEKMKLDNLMILPTSLATSYAYGSLQNCAVIDIGVDHTDIIPIVDYTPLDYVVMSTDVGGASINSRLASLLPGWTAEQIEDLKCSPIFEVLSRHAKDQLRFNFDEDEGSMEDEGTLDVAAIVTSNRDTIEILEEREKNKNKEQLSNSRLEINTFIDRSGNEISVGKQRFQGCENLIKSISTACGLVLSHVQESTKSRSVWENILITGGTSTIAGFKEALITQLCKDHLIIEPDVERQQREGNYIAAVQKQKKNKYMSSTIANGLLSLEYVQNPTIIKTPKFPEYFTEWKKRGCSDVVFLGAQIVSKQVFGHSNDSFYMTRKKYDESGPSGIWDVCF